MKHHNVEVVHGHGKGAGRIVAARAARIAAVRVMAAAAKNGQCRLGLGAGFTTRAIVEELIPLLSREAKPPNLVIHALSTGVEISDARVTPIAMFTLFEAAGLTAEYIGLQATATVSSVLYDSVLKEHGVAQAFRQRQKIDVIISSLASTDRAGPRK